MRRDLRDLSLELRRYSLRAAERIRDPQRAIADEQLREQHEERCRREAALAARELGVKPRLAPKVTTLKGGGVVGIERGR